MTGISMVGVAKRFGTIQALKGVDLEVEPGQVVALLGANGAGKTTLVRIGATTVIPDSGSVSIAGHDAVASPAKARSRTGVVMSEERSFYWRMSGRMNLEFFASLHGLRKREARSRAVEVLEAVAFPGDPDVRVDRYSSGMRARLAVARGLLGRPDVLLLDEPSRSLDPVAALSLRKLVLDLAATRNVAVLFVTHDLHEAAAVASVVVAIMHGEVAATLRGPTDASALERIFVEAEP
jgi:ABC-2 type transport system ATP-binding protein